MELKNLITIGCTHNLDLTVRKFCNCTFHTRRRKKGSERGDNGLFITLVSKVVKQMNKKTLLYWLKTNWAITPNWTYLLYNLAIKKKTLKVSVSKLVTIFFLSLNCILNDDFRNWKWMKIWMKTNWMKTQQLMLMKKKI